jgi:hypothetical protein
MYGLDLLGIAKFEKVAVSEFPADWALGCFSSTFGDARSAVEAILQSGKCPLVRVQLMWKELHDYSPKDFPWIRNEAKKWRGLVAKYKIAWHFSGACEHNLSVKDAKTLAEIVTKELPGTTYVNNPQSQGKNELPGYLIERHGKDVKKAPRDYVFSFDGSNCVDNDVQTIKDRLTSASVFFFWGCRFNGRWSENEQTSIPLRNGYPDKEYMRSIVALAQPQGEVKIPKGWIWKSHSENNGVTDPRSEKPVLICPVKTKEAVLVLTDGSKVRLPYYGPYAGGGHRYYAPTWGYQIANEPVTLLMGGKLYAVINPTFRAGVFR